MFLRISETEDLNRVGKVVHASTSATPDEIQNLAMQWSTKRYFESHSSIMSSLEAKSDEDSVHTLAHMNRMSGRDEVALRTLSIHLKSNSQCIRAATEIAEIFHDRDEIDHALQILSPAMNAPNLPTPTFLLLNHLMLHSKSKFPAGKRM